MLKRFFILGLIFFTSFTFAEKKTTCFVLDQQKQLVEKVETPENTLNDMDQEIEKEFSSPDFHKTFIKMVLSLIAIVVLAFVTLLSFKKINRSRIESLNNNKDIKVLEKRMISPKSMLYLIEYENKKILISESHLDVKMKILE